MLPIELVKYPFLPRAREVLAATPVDRNMPQKDAVLDQAKYRLHRAIEDYDLGVQVGQDTYHTYLSRPEHRKEYIDDEVVEFYSFFTSVMVASKENFLATALAQSEARRARWLFTKESDAVIPKLMSDAIGLTLTPKDGKFTCGFADYLMMGSKYGLFKRKNDETWALSRQPLSGGIIFYTRNSIVDLFGALVNGLITQGIAGLKKATMPPFISDLGKDLEQYIPLPPPTNTTAFRYVENLLKHPITDGRNRTIWLVLAPYCVNVKHDSVEQAIARLNTYVGSTTYSRFITYQVKRADRYKLLPLSESKLREAHKDLYEIFSKAGVFNT
jgi:hypothetical protein